MMMAQLFPDGELREQLLKHGDLTSDNLIKSYLEATAGSAEMAEKCFWLLQKLSVELVVEFKNQAVVHDENEAELLKGFPLLVDYQEGRVKFTHHSVSEYLVATHMVQILREEAKEILLDEEPQKIILACDGPYLNYLITILSQMLSTFDPVVSTNSWPERVLENCVRWEAWELVKLVATSGAVDAKSILQDGRGFLHSAAERGDGQLVELLIANGADVNAINDFGETPLFRAFWGHRDEETVQILLQHGARFDEKSCNEVGRIGLSVYDWLHHHFISADNDYKKGILNKIACGAAVENNLDLLQRLWSDGADFQSVDEDGENCLHLAAQSGNLECVEFLSGKIDLDSLDRYKRTPLQFAAGWGHEAVTEFLVAKGADVTLQDDDGWTALHWAAWRSHLSCCEILVKVTSVDCRNVNGETPLMAAARGGQLQCVQLLVANGANAKLRDNKGKSALHHATEGDNAQVVEIIYNLDPTQMNVRSDNGTTPLMEAATVRFGRQYESEVWTIIKAVEFLLEKGADASLVDAQGKNLLHRSAEQGETKTLKRICELRPELVESRSGDGLTVLMLACAEDDKVEFLLSINADPRLVDAEGRNCLHHAAEKASKETLERICELCPDLLDSPSRDGRTPLMFAAASGREAESKVEFLLSIGADLNGVDVDGKNLLHYAAKGGDSDLVETILKLDPTRLNGTSQNGSTPLMEAAKCEFWHAKPVIEFLLENGADPNLVDAEGKNCLHHAAENGREESIELLLEKVEVNAKTAEGKTASTLAKENGHDCVVEVIENFVKCIMNENI